MYHFCFFQNVDDTLILHGNVNCLEANNSQLFKTCETIYVELCEEERIINVPVGKSQGRLKALPSETDFERCAICKLKKGHRNICPMCGKCSKQPSDLKRHLRTHTGERPFECRVCGQKFKCTSSMYQHQRNVHNFNMKKQMNKAKKKLVY